MSLVRFRPEAPYADLAHLVERNLAKVEVAGSSPIQVANASVAQSVEQGTENPRVDGSIPSGGTISMRS